MSNHSAGYMMGEAIEYMIQEGILDKLEIKESGILLEKLTNIVCRWDGNSGEVFEGLDVSKYKVCNCCGKYVEEGLKDGYCKSCFEYFNE